MYVYLSNWRNNCLTNTHLKNKMCANLPHVGTKNAKNIIVRPNCQPYQSQAIIKSSRKRLIIGARKDTIHSNLHPVLVTMVRVNFFGRWSFTVVQPLEVVLISYSTWVGNRRRLISKHLFPKTFCRNPIPKKGWIFNHSAGKNKSSRLKKKNCKNGS